VRASRPPLLRLLLGLTLALALCPGCGYSLARYGRGGERERRVSIQTLENDSSEPGVELLVTDALRREFLSRGGLRLVSDPKRADLVIRGRVEPIATRARSFSSVVLALEYELTLSLDLRFETRGGEPLDLGFDRASFEDTEVYLASADVEAGRKNRLEALRRVADLLASRVHDSVDRAALQ
jgi:hypothetical protein